mmetsp:Transcript_16155/g.34985  ORF Transcript_16155/g.34985 Transcript_16155/m.34985 type:complete len:201 (-) Transcript_16155:333-935(-)|eukprot:CAMPEP_0202890298 /NCGR_PEP_ID=MMETSP1392-20130828/757_1 /ASSEMBLY_ACC=CAM_ASM_000868 /TAXON_ID=225041 /ORGANISM="Chlamydomonas chlamydogama, Strain SAG 11-48b" /LENGTH=200 /DNA_ID=CAMNT_0049573843 /DNA_START=84 /DNA_END=686 /DNA_ORIENTATION=+
MEAEPIYCAEQIVVPADLADILKAYTKEVIRRQPEDILEFSAKYFANLAHVAGSAPVVSVPQREQLRLLHERAAGESQLSTQQITALCTQAGIDKAVVGQVLDAGHFSDAVDVDKFLFLLLAMTCENFAAVIQGIFELFGQELPTQRFINLVSHLAPDMDPDITTQFLSDLASALLDVGSVTYDQVVTLDLPALQEKLAA